MLIHVNHNFLLVLFYQLIFRLYFQGLSNGCPVSIAKSLFSVAINTCRIHLYCSWSIIFVHCLPAIFELKDSKKFQLADAIA